MKLFLITILATFGFSTSLTTISGFITDAESGEALIGANVFLKNTNYGTAANTDGYFVINSVKQGDYILQTSYLGYEFKEIPINITSNKNTRIDVELKSKMIEGEAVEVTAEKKKFQREILTSRITINPLKLRKLPQMGETDLFRTIQMLPGIRSQSELSSGLIIRGGNTDQNLILYDGITVYNPSHLGGVFSNFITEGVHEAELVKGAYPAQYGGRLSGVLDIRSKYGNSKKFAGSVEISLISSKALIEGPIGKGGFLLTARRTYIDKMIEIMNNAKIIDFTFPYYFFDFQGNIFQDFTENDRVSFSIYSGDDKFDWPEILMGFNWGNRTISARWRHLFNEKLFSNFLIADSRFWINMDMGGFLKEDDDIVDRTAKGDLTYFVSDNNQLKFGVELKDLEIHYLATFNDSIEIAEIHQTPIYGAIYYNQKLNYHPWVFQVGFRWNYYDWAEEPLTNTSRFSVKRLVTDNSAFSFSVGRYYQHIFTMNDEYSIQIINAWIAQDKTVPTQYGDQAILGFEYFSYNYNFTAEFYAKTMNNLLVYKEDRASMDDNSGFDNPTVSDMFTPSDAVAWGAEFMVEKKVGSVTGNISYTHSYVVKEIADEPKYWANWDRRHEFKSMVNWEINKKWSLGSVFQFGDGYPYTKMLGTYPYWEPGNEDPTYQQIPGTRNNERLPNYHRLDVSLTRHFTNSWFDGDFYLNIINIYNHRNIEGVYWDTDSLDDGEPAEKDELKMLPILPTIGFRINFR
ncbi:MAG: TonB-dependent receptor [Candidatus Marinimicrobia bacterium]|nr:TonB-dependent receptor [Candidatus Neomarinimicrobiota bacterium]MBL7022426.1 TonB-dependent receptor [Candidatus Neomarinimicrobiota bacterium]MBL7109473.1 TonB-dependent receptor [Candidatus Neomarinimicrobiota bacterium]